MWFKDVLADGQTGHRSGHNLAGNINNPLTLLTSDGPRNHNIYQVTLTTL